MNDPDTNSDATAHSASKPAADQNTVTADADAPAPYVPDTSTVTRVSGGVYATPEITQARAHDVTLGHGVNSPSVVTGYDVSREIARGGMGVVYAGHDPVLDREVAIKVMHPGQDADRFVVESKVTAQLPHPGVPPVYALGTLADGRPYLAMKLIRGRTLAAELKASDRVADLPRLLGVFERICETVGFAHDRGIVHRDLKPANVMVGAFGEVLVMDWGLAKEVRDDRPTFDLRATLENPQYNETLTGQVKGTPAYMAPEQARGEPVDVRADVFALGGILAVTLTGKPPFAGNSVDETVEKAAQAKVDECFARLAESGADAELIALAKRCLSPDVADRPDNGAQVAAAVAAYRTGVEERLRRAERERAAADARAEEEANTRREAEAKVAEQRRRRRAQLAATAAVMVGLLVAAAGGGYYLHRQNLDLKATVAHEQAVAVLRGECTNRLATAEAALNRRDWPGAVSGAEAVLAAVGQEPELADLRDRATALRADAENIQAFLAHHDRLMYHAVLAQEEGDRAYHQQTARTAARAGLALFGLSDTSSAPRFPERLSEPLRRWLTESCYEAYLTWTDVELADPAVPSDERAKPALGLLDRAAALGLTTRTWHLRRAELHSALMDEPRAAAEQKRADAITAADAVDHFLLGAAANRIGRSDEASEHFKRVLERNPTHFWSNYYLATCLMRARPQRFERALAPLTTCVQLKPQFVWSYLLRGLANGALGDFEAATADFARAEKLNPDELARYALLNNRAVIGLRASAVHEDAARRARASGRAADADRETRLADRLHEAAVSDLVRATELRPQQPQAFATLADAHLHRNRLDAALPPLNRALELAPTAALYRKRSQLHATHRDHAAALRDIDEAIRFAAGKGGADEIADDHLNRGQLLFRLKRWEDALAAYDAALALAPDRPSAHQARGEALLELGRYPDAAAAMDRYQAKGPPQALASRARALCRAKLGQYSGAIEDYTRALEIDRLDGKPVDGPTLVQRGWAYLIVDAPKLALRDFDTAAKLTGAHRADGLSGRGSARVLLREWRLAVQDADASLREEEPKSRTLMSAARIHSQASAMAFAELLRTNEEEAVRLRDQYRDRALKLLRRACEQIPEAERARFWADTVHTDPALTAIRETAEYQRMAQTFAAMK